MMKAYEFKEIRLWVHDYYDDDYYDNEPEPASKTFIEQLNDYGKEGWMIVQLLDESRHTRAYLLQRERPSGSPYRD